jgi:hypothetical protein
MMNEKFSELAIAEAAAEETRRERDEAERAVHMWQRRINFFSGAVIGLCVIAYLLMRWSLFGWSLGLFE